MSAPVVVVAGPPGAGKSTVAAGLARRYPRAVHLHTDDFWHAIVAGGLPPYLPEADAQNHVVMGVLVGAAARYAEGGYTTIVDGIVGPWMLPHLFRRMDAPWHYIILRPSREVTLARATSRADGLTDPEPVTAMWDQFAALGAHERHAMDTSGWSIEETVDEAFNAVTGGSHRLSSHV